MSRRGSNAVEFALLLPILVALLSGVVDLGQLLLVSENVVEAVADGAQAGALANTARGETPVALAKSVAEKAFEASGSQGHLVVTAATSTSGGEVTLTVTGVVSFEYIFGWFQLPSTVTLSNSMRVAD